MLRSESFSVRSCTLQEFFASNIHNRRIDTRSEHRTTSDSCIVSSLGRHKWCVSVFFKAGEQSVAAVICFIAYYLLNTTGFDFDLFEFQEQCFVPPLSGLWVGVSGKFFVSLTLSLLHV